MRERERASETEQMTEDCVWTGTIEMWPVESKSKLSDSGDVCLFLSCQLTFESSVSELERERTTPVDGL